MTDTGRTIYWGHWWVEFLDNGNSIARFIYPVGNDGPKQAWATEPSRAAYWSEQWKRWGQLPAGTIKPTAYGSIR